MTSRIVCDASAIIAALLDSGDDGQWATARMADADLYAPTLLPYECANVMRRHERGGAISPDQAVQAHMDLLHLPFDYWPYDPLAQRIWELRDNLSSYDATYVALAEAIGATVITLDRRLPRTPHLECEIACPAADS